MSFCTQKGFTLIEMLIALAIGSILLAGICNVFINQQKVYSVREQVAEMQQNVRIAMTMMVREIRMAGYGAPKSQISSWITWVPGISTNPQITQGSGSDPDSISIIGSFDAPIASLATAAATGTTTLNLSSGEGSKFNTTTKKIFYIGTNENGVITGISGNTLTIDTDPTNGNQGLTRSYPAGTSLQLLKVITYEIVDNTLKRNENTGAGRQPLAENIEDLQITQNGNFLTISLTGRTSKPDPAYTHPTQGDNYRRMTLSSQVRIRNLGL